MISKETITTIAEQLDWTVEFEEGCASSAINALNECYAEFRQYSPAGEDFSFYVGADTFDGIVRQVDSHANDFDVEEHVKLWLDAKYNGVGGVPGIVELVKDAEAIKQMLLDLAEALKDPDKFLNKKTTRIYFDIYVHLVGETELDGNEDNIEETEEDGELLWLLQNKLNLEDKLRDVGSVEGISTDTESLCEGSVKIAR